jgi:phytanoyl-CoA hydroxylase
MGALMRSLGQRRPTPVQSMYITKQPSIGGEVVPHQDSAFLSTSPETCVGFWVALEDATRANGCLWVLPRSHAAGVAKRFVLTPSRTTRWAADDGRTDADAPAGAPPTWSEVSEANGWLPLEVPAGGAVVLHGACVHASAANTSAASRHAYSVHFVEADATWAHDNWMHRAPDFPPVPLAEEADGGDEGAGA